MGGGSESRRERLELCCLYVNGTTIVLSDVCVS